MTTIVLFDLDGTLVLTGGAGRRAMQRAFEVVCGTGCGLEGMAFGGMTDQLIVRTALRAIGHDDGPTAVGRVLDAYLDALPAEVASSPDYRVLPGVQTLLEVLAGEPVTLGLGTGNVEAGARTKLARGDLWRYFAFGGFGSDHEDRVELLRAGAERGAASAGRPLESCRVVVVGDTPRDVEAALALGAECVGVGTGGHSPSELERLGARRAFADLTAAGVLAALLEEEPAQ